jgi:hypothetical protein
MNKKAMQAVTEALRDALTAYSVLEQDGMERVAIAQRLFGVAATQVLLPQLDEIARNVKQRPE